MKRICALFLILTIVVAATACSQQAGPAETPTSVPPAEASAGIVTFSDPVLEAMVRATMGKPEGGITVAEAEAVTRLSLSTEWQRYISQETPIKDIGGLESFTNLESLDLSFLAITDITPLAGLKKLTSLSLSNNPVADISPLAGLTNLKVLILTGCKAQDYAPLAKLVNLDFLMLDHATIADVSPLASLTKLKHLYLAGSPINNYFPLSDIYQNLEQKDFTIAFTLAELGFTMNDANNQASYGDVQRDGLSVNINHAEWGAPQSEDMTKCVRMDLMLDSGYTLVVLYYPEISAYVFQMNINGEQMNYIYNAADGTFMVDSNNRERFERMITEALGETGETDALLAPIPVFNDAIHNTFGISADVLYALPFERLSLLSLGFKANHDEAECVYEQHEGNYTSIAVHRPEWGDQEYSVHFFTSINEYGVMVRYYIDEQRYYIRAEADDGSSADFEFFWETHAKNDNMSPEGITVEEYFQNVYDNPEIADVYLYSVLMAQQYISDTFGMSIDELYALSVQ